MSDNLFVRDSHLNVPSRKTQSQLSFVWILFHFLHFVLLLPKAQSLSTSVLCKCHSLSQLSMCDSLSQLSNCDNLSQLSRHCAGPTTELGIVLVPTIPSLHDQLAVGKVGVVNTIVINLDRKYYETSES